MKKLLMLILICLLVALGAFIAIEGFEVGSAEVLSYTGIQERSNSLDDKIQEASKLIGKDYKQAVNTVQSDAKKLQDTKRKYEDKFVVNTDGTIDETSIIDRYGKYKIETLWVKLGNHATKEGTTMKMEVRGGTPIGIIQNSNNKSPAKFYDLSFTVYGEYISILDFVSDIENDSELGFKIENFKMLKNAMADSSEKLQATFICKDIAIEDISQLGGGSSTAMDTTRTPTDTTGATNTTNTNTTGATNTATNTNTTGTTNTNSANNINSTTAGTTNTTSTNATSGNTNIQ